MVSKGISYLGHITTQASIDFAGPGVGGSMNGPCEMLWGALEIDSKNIHGWTGTFQWTASGLGKNGSTVQHHEDISSLTGEMEGGT